MAINPALGAQPEEKPLYRRVLLKISGESLMGDAEYGVNPPTVAYVASRIIELHRAGVSLALVVGGGNIFRGVAGASQGMERGSADAMGMLATVMNALALEGALKGQGAEARVMSAIPMPTICEPFSASAARRHLDEGRIVVFAGGTGNPFFTTDTAATLRALETGCDVLWKATQVDGVYDSDPRRNSGAQRYDEVDYDEVLRKDLKVMDGAAIALARDNNLPVVVFALQAEGGFTPILYGRGRYTLVRPS